jgi:hypothetical protein
MDIFALLLVVFAKLFVAMERWLEWRIVMTETLLAEMDVVHLV